MTAARSVARNTLFLSLAQGIRILLGFVLILYIANRYGVLWQGKFSILLAFLNIFQVMASFGLPRLITREVARDPAAGSRYFWAGIVGQGATTVIFAILMFGVVSLSPYPADTRAMLQLAILALPLFTLYSVAAALLRAYERMEYLVYAEVLSSLAQVVLAVTVLARAENVLALAVIRIGGLSLAAVMAAAAAWRMQMIGRPQIDLRFSFRLLRQSADFFGMAAFDSILQRMDVLILSIIGGETAAGIYDAAFQLIKVIMTLVMSFTDALYPVLSRLFVQSRLRFGLVTGKSLHYGLVALLPVAVGTAVLAPAIIALFYRRPEYGPAAGVLAVAGATTLAYFAQIVLTRALAAGDRARASLLATGLMVVAGAALIAGFSAIWGPAGTATGVGLMYALGAVFACYASRDFQIAFAANYLARPALAAVVMGAFLYFLPSLPLWLAIPAGAALYAAAAMASGVLNRGDLQLFHSLLSKP
jgi:O-antigen/teichoic acid export membrane protein